MKLFKYMKDGGPESCVWGYWLIEAKKLFSIALLKFSDGSRDAFHSHAFNSISWVIKGCLHEHRVSPGEKDKHTLFLPSLKPIITTRDNLHRVISTGTTWVITFRGPWSSTWKEYFPSTQETITLSDGRKVVDV